MKKMVFSAAMLAACAIPAVAAEGVAQLGDVNGKVLVNTGKGFVPAEAGLVLGAGAKVMIGEDSFATLTFDNCAVSLDKPTVFTVKAEACQAGAQTISPVADVAADDDGAALLPLLLLGGGAAAVGVGILVLTDDDDNVPVTPEVVVD